jgi:hypothetical protein
MARGIKFEFIHEIIFNLLILGDFHVYPHPTPTTPVTTTASEPECPLNFMQIFFNKLTISCNIIKEMLAFSIHYYYYYYDADSTQDSRRSEQNISILKNIFLHAFSRHSTPPAHYITVSQMQRRAKEMNETKDGGESRHESRVYR